MSVLDLFDKAPGQIAVINTLLKLVESNNPTFNNPVEKGASMQKEEAAVNTSSIVVFSSCKSTLEQMSLMYL